MADKFISRRSLIKSATAACLLVALPVPTKGLRIRIGVDLAVGKSYSVTTILHISQTGPCTHLLREQLNVYLFHLKRYLAVEGCLTNAALKELPGS